MTGSSIHLEVILILILLRYVAINMYGYGEVGNLYMEVGRAMTNYRANYKVLMSNIAPAH